MGVVLLPFLIWGWTGYVVHRRLQIRGLSGAGVLHQRLLNCCSLPCVQPCSTLREHRKRSDANVECFTYVSRTSKIIAFSKSHKVLMSHGELHHGRGNRLTPCAAQEAFFLPVCCYFSQPTSKVRTPKARVVRALCLLSMCVIASFGSWGPGRELECLTAGSFKEQRARHGRHMLHSYGHITAQKVAARR